MYTSFSDQQLVHNGHINASNIIVKHRKTRKIYETSDLSWQNTQVSPT